MIKQTLSAKRAATTTIAEETEEEINIDDI